MNAQPDELDRWLDDALAEYRAPAPRAGLELRALAYVRSRQQARGRANWRAWALAAAAVVVVVVAVQMYRRTSTRVQPIAQTPGPTVTAPRPEVTTAAQAKPAVTRPATRKAQRATIATVAVPPQPRLETFPSPQPLTAEERMLLAVIRRSPGALSQMARQQGTLAPLVVDEIRIQPLEEKVISTGDKK